MQWSYRTFSILAACVAALSLPAWADPITINATTESLSASNSSADIPGVGTLSFYPLDLVPTTNTDEELRVLGGGTLNNVGDSITLPFQLTLLYLTAQRGDNNFNATKVLTINGTQPIGSITIDYTRLNEGGTLSATLPVDLAYTGSGMLGSTPEVTFDDTLTMEGN